MDPLTATPGFVNPFNNDLPIAPAPKTATPGSSMTEGTSFAGSKLAEYVDGITGSLRRCSMLSGEGDG
ncbi:hypothetical protein AB4Z38_21355 [Arthrobacter sp. 2RAF6]|uniref:hypothetical protein n=1 Tax=Arthrobacter sp. 2RAF6 TaxID=3233002 RepID=UPI003F8EBD8F